ncbi:MAG: hypothetical protein JSR58_06090 [Verrucomicrobia bacterium]|nr:hypothetical protein [Verrucomicrobiota bacterium]
MLEVGSTKKNKITLSDYNYRRDIDNRLLMASFSTLDLAVLEEILFSPLQLPLSKIVQSIGESEKVIRGILEKLSKTGLLALQGDQVVVDKEMRKYFEVEAAKFDPDFKPDMDFLQHILRKVPIHVLPTWYAIPRTSNNIFDSLMEKYFATPHLFQRYLHEVNLGDTTLTAIAQDVMRAPDFRMTAKDLMHKYDLSQAQFEEAMLLLEFHFICCLTFERSGSHWKEIVTPFYEWRQYLTFLRDTSPAPIKNPEKVKRLKAQDFSFVQDMTAALETMKKQPQVLSKLGADAPYTERVVHRLLKLQLAEQKQTKFSPTPAAKEWLDDRIEGRAMYMYRHPASMIPEKVLREAEKSLMRVLYAGWVYFEDFLKGTIVPLNDQGTVSLKKVGKTWKYTLPSYTEEEKALLKSIILDWFFEVGITAVGTHEDKECFLVTPFGQSLFG